MMIDDDESTDVGYVLQTEAA